MQIDGFLANQSMSMQMDVNGLIPCELTNANRLIPCESVNAMRVYANGLIAANANGLIPANANLIPVNANGCRCEWIDSF
jgi:hypothetical protein